MTDKYLKIMADYSSTGLWDRFGIEITLEEVSELPFWWVPKLKEWTEWYEENDDWMEESEHDFPYHEFSAAGRDLAQKLANILIDWEIWYVDEEALIEDVKSDVINEQTYLSRILPSPKVSVENT